MEEQLISFQTAKLAKEKGFNIKTLECYNSNTKVTSVSYNEILAPTQSLLQKWLREVHKVEVLVFTMTRYNNFSTRIASEKVIIDGFKEYHCNINGEAIPDPIGEDTYEEALEEGLQRALNLIDDE